MEEMIAFVAERVIVLINAMVLAIIAFGTLQALYRGVLAVLGGAADDVRLRGIYLRFGHWLVAALTFQLAADILETSIAPTLQDVGRLGAVAFIRVFLNYFLERDMTKMQENLEPPANSA